MALADIMTKNVISVSPEETVEGMHQILSKRPIHHLLVIENDILVGIVSDKEIYQTRSPFANTKVQTERDIFTLNRKAHQIMKKKPPTISVHSGIRVAGAEFLKYDVSLLPVVDIDNKVIGVLSWKDVIRYIIA